MADRTPQERLRHLLVAAFTEDRQRNPGKPTDPRSMHILVERMLATPAGQVLEREWVERAPRVLV